MATLQLKELPIGSIFKVVGSSTMYTKKSYANASTGKIACSYIPSNAVGTKKYKKICFRQINELKEVRLVKPIQRNLL
jgi:hypothetical protein